MNNVSYDFMFRLASKAIDNEAVRWSEEAFRAQDAPDYYQMLGMAQGLEIAKKILDGYCSSNVEPGMWGESD